MACRRFRRMRRPCRVPPDFVSAVPDCAIIRAASKEKAMIRPRRIGHATFETPDLDKSIAYYERFMGLIVAEREKERAFLATKIGQLVIALNRSYRAHCIKLSFEVAPQSDFGELSGE